MRPVLVSLFLLVSSLLVGCAGSARPPTSPPSQTSEAAAPTETAPSTATTEPAPATSEPAIGQPPVADVASLGGTESPATAPARHGATQVEIAAKVNAEGTQAMDAKQYAIASAKFREAAARVPEPSYFFNLCLALYLEGRFGEALTACTAAQSNASAALLAKTEALIAQLRAEAKRQHIALD